jgi:hypothetical protein
MKIAILFLSFLSLTCSCHNKEADKDSKIKFDKTKWQTKEADAYPYRDKMLDDLVDNITLKGLKKNELLELLGPPTRADGDYLFYTIKQPHFGPIPLSNKSLVIKLTKDSTVEWRKIHE